MTIQYVSKRLSFFSVKRVKRNDVFLIVSVDLSTIASIRAGISVEEHAITFYWRDAHGASRKIYFFSFLAMSTRITNLKIK